MDALNWFRRQPYLIKLIFTLNSRFLILRKRFKTNHRIRFCSRKFKLPVLTTEKKSSYPTICFKFSRNILKKTFSEIDRFEAISNLEYYDLTYTRIIENWSKPIIYRGFGVSFPVFTFSQYSNDSTRAIPFTSILNTNN